jgi:hypothetical protein
MKFTGYGTLSYKNTWLLVEISDDLGIYYRSLINSYSRSTVLQKPMNGEHITVIAGKYEVANHSPNWRKYEGEKIEFQYSSDIQTDYCYFWLPVTCNRIEEIRIELGLKPTIKCPWHITVGNLKHYVK